MEADRFASDLARRQAEVQPGDIEITKYGNGTTSSDRGLASREATADQCSDKPRRSSITPER